MNGSVAGGPYRSMGEAEDVVETRLRNLEKRASNEGLWRRVLLAVFVLMVPLTLLGIVSVVKHVSSAMCVAAKP